MKITQKPELVRKRRLEGIQSSQKTNAETAYSRKSISIASNMIQCLFDSLN
jgi:hypothetical protein